MSAPPRVCPFCASPDIALAIESTIADSYLCPHCHVYFCVTSSAPQYESWVSTSTRAIDGTCEHSWDYTQQSTGTVSA